MCVCEMWAVTLGLMKIDPIVRRVASSPRVDWWIVTATVAGQLQLIAQKVGKLLSPWRDVTEGLYLENKIARRVRNTEVDVAASWRLSHLLTFINRTLPQMVVGLCR